MIYKHDRITYNVTYRIGEKMYKLESSNYQYVLETFYNLNCIAFLGFNATYQGSSVSASLMKRNKHGNVEIIHQHYLNKIEQFNNIPKAV